MAASTEACQRGKGGLYSSACLTTTTQRPRDFGVNVNLKSSTCAVYEPSASVDQAVSLYVRSRRRWKYIIYLTKARSSPDGLTSPPGRDRYPSGWFWAFGSLPGLSFDHQSSRRPTKLVQAAVKLLHWMICLNPVLVFCLVVWGAVFAKEVAFCEGAREGSD